MGCVNWREQVSLGSPPTAPGVVPQVPRPQFAWRAHRVRSGRDSGAWWFSSGSGGRFDLPAPDGTCYLASDPQTAVRERLGPRLALANEITDRDVYGVVVSCLPVPEGPGLVDTLSREAVQVAGLTREISTVVDYALTCAWAVWFATCGCGGVRYAARHTTGQDEVAFAVFGRAGAAADLPSPRECVSVRDVLVGVGVQVVSEAPRRGELRVVDPGSSR